MNINHWSCNKPIQNDKVSQNAKCEIVCLDGFDVVVGKNTFDKKIGRVTALSVFACILGGKNRFFIRVSQKLID